MNVPFLQDTTFTGLISTKNYGTSQDWSQAYSLVQANSATWEESSEVIPTVTAYLSTNFVTLCSTDSKGQILSAGVPLHNIFLTSETDSQILNYNTTTELLSISNGNSVSLASLNDKGYINNNFLNLTGGTVAGNLTVQGNISALGTATFANTIFTTTSALSVVNTGPGPALYVFQAAGPYDVASFYDGDGIEVLHVGNAGPGGFGKVGVNESFPNEELTVRGSISATESIFATSFLSGGVDLKNIFLTSETDSQTLYYTESASTLFITNGNSVSLTALDDKEFAVAMSIGLS